jgi:hypothetical protein
VLDFIAKAKHAGGERQGITNATQVRRAADKFWALFDLGVDWAEYLQPYVEGGKTVA